MEKKEDNFLEYYYRSYERLEKKVKELKEQLQDVQTDEMESEIHVELSKIYAEMKTLDRELWAYEAYEEGK